MRDFKVWPGTVDDLKKIVSFDAEIGVFTWVDQRGKKSKKAGFNRKDGYMVLTINYQPFLGHRLAWLYVYGTEPKYTVDHINGIPSDNRIANLRDVPHEVNMQNRTRPQKNSRYLLIGVGSNTPNRYWAKVKHRGVVHHLGSFDSQEEAHAQYVIAKRRLHEGCTL